VLEIVIVFDGCVHRPDLSKLHGFAFLWLHVIKIWHNSRAVCLARLDHINIRFEVDSLLVAVLVSKSFNWAVVLLFLESESVQELVVLLLLLLGVFDGIFPSEDFVIIFLLASVLDLDSDGSVNCLVLGLVSSSPLFEHDDVHDGLAVGFYVGSLLEEERSCVEVEHATFHDFVLELVIFLVTSKVSEEIGISVDLHLHAMYIHDIFIPIHLSGVQLL